MAQKTFLAKTILGLYVKLMKIRKELISVTCFDCLTGASNKQNFEKNAVKCLEENKNDVYSIVIFDIRKFRIFNEMYKKQVGDRLLSFIALNLNKNLLPEREVFTRVNADEFAVMFCAKDKKTLTKRMSTAFSKLKDSLSVNGKVKINLCFGVYFAKSGESFFNAYEKAKFAHKEAKSCRLNDFSIFDREKAKIEVREAFVEKKMEKALEKGEFKLFLQAQYDVKNNTVSGAEALVRWEIKRDKYLMPAAFLELFEKNGFILKLDYFMFHKVCRLIRFWIDNNIKPVCISVNFSRQHVSTKNWVENLSSIAQKYRVPKKLLNIEITESFALENEEALIEKTNMLKEKGFNLSIDDFGSGYSSLGILNSLPVNEIKLDRSFFIKDNSNEKTQYIIKYIILMAKSLGIKTVAEGIEEEYQVRNLLKLNCDIIQGYYFAKPVPARDFFSK